MLVQYITNLSFLSPAARKLIISQVLTGMTDNCWKFRQLLHWTYFRLRFLLIICSIDCIQVMRTFFCDFLNRFIAFLWIDGLLLKTVAIYCTSIEFIPFRICYLDWLAFIMRIGCFFVEERAVSCIAIKRLIIRIVLHIFYIEIFLHYLFRTEFVKILRSGTKRYTFVLIFHTRNYFLSHLRFLTWKMFSISWIYIAVRLIRLRFWIRFEIL